MAIIRIEINDQIIDGIQHRYLDFNNCLIKEKVSPSGLTVHYDLECGEYFYSWEQENIGGEIKFIEESAELFATIGDASRIVKEIKLEKISIKN